MTFTSCPAEGGEPLRLTWHPGGDQVIDWHPDGKSRALPQPRAKAHRRDLPAVHVATAACPEGAPAHGGLASYSPDGKQIAYNRITRETAPGSATRAAWPRTSGSPTSDRRHRPGHRLDRHRQFPHVDRRPRLLQQRRRPGVCRSGAHDLTTGQKRQVTNHQEYDVKNPSLGPDAIVYENGGWLFVLDLKTEKSRKITVSLRSDNTLTRPGIKKVNDLISGGDIAPDAKRAVFSARGDIFTVPAEKGNVRNLTATPGIRERDAVWTPDGKQVAYLSDQTGEYEIWLTGADGKGDPKRLTTGNKTFKMDMVWSPDSKHLALSDAAMNLWLVDAESGKMTHIDQSVTDEIHPLLEPSCRLVGLRKGEENGFNSIFLYNLAQKKPTA